MSQSAAKTSVSEQSLCTYFLHVVISCETTVCVYWYCHNVSCRYCYEGHGVKSIIPFNNYLYCIMRGLTTTNELDNKNFAPAISLKEISCKLEA